MIHIYRKYVVSRYFHFFDLVHGVIIWRFIPLQYLNRFSCMSMIQDLCNLILFTCVCLFGGSNDNSFPFEYNYHMFYMNQERHLSSCTSSPSSGMQK
uniref:Uncharacterized protein n=1 Tax=Aegilops tauschii subsp. strangulata TaxID=200361 RepID=A0A452YRY2_AEGTS